MRISLNSKQMISVIVPVYNTEKYLDRCIQSILAQTYTNFELLLIDDGSTDSSGAICEKYAESDSRIRVFHKENGGVSSARNMGLDNAKGEWVTFIDSDDTIKEDFLKNLLPKQNEDFVMDSSDERSASLPDGSYVGKEMIKVVLSGWQILCPWGKMFKKSIVSKNKIRFDESGCLGEDTLFNLRYLVYADSLRTMTRSYYNYNNDNEGSLSKKKEPLEKSLYKATSVYKIGLQLSSKYGDSSLEVLISKYAGITWTLWWSLLQYPISVRVKYIKQFFQTSDMLSLMTNYLRCAESGKKYAIFYWLCRLRLYRIAASIIP